MLCNEITGRCDGSSEPEGVCEGSIADRGDSLRSFCRRVYGWDRGQAALVEDAMGFLLSAITRCAVIPLRGQGDLVPIAHALHRRMFGTQRPFVVCDPRRHEGDGSVRSPPNRRTSARALDAAAGGSVCIRSVRLPVDYPLLAPSRRDSTGTQLFVCLDKDDPIVDLLYPPLRIPSLAERAPDLERLLAEYVDDATQALGVSSMRLSGAMLAAILSRAESLADLEKSATRVVVLKSAPNISRAAEQLGMAPVSLTRWASRRGLLDILNS